MNTQLEFTKEIEKNTAGIYQKIKSVVPALEWPLHAPYIYKINELKKKKNAVILAITIKLQKFIMESLILLGTL